MASDGSGSSVTTRMVGSETAHVLEFAEQPVLVVPTPEPDGRRAQATGWRTTVFSLPGRPHVAVEPSGAT